MQKNFNVVYDDIVVKDVATKVGKVIDLITNGKYNAEEKGKKIDEKTKNVTINL